MKKAEQRIFIIGKHVDRKTRFSPCTDKQLSLTITPEVALMDEKVHILLTGLKTDQTITLRASLDEGGCRFESCGVYRASQDGTIDNRIDPCIAGTFVGVEPMGLFWSLKPASGQDPYTRMIKKDVTTPLIVTVDAFYGNLSEEALITQSAVTSMVVHRFYKSASVRRIPLKHEKFRGTIFIPEGPGPFPGVIDMYGGFISLCETRAALLASRGYATYSLSYLPVDFNDPVLNNGGIDPYLIKDAVTWFSQKEYVDENRLGFVGLCYGGFLSLLVTALCPAIKVLVSINSPCILPFDRLELTPDGRYEVKDKFLEKMWPEMDKIFEVEEGLVVNRIHYCDDARAIPAWKHGAQLFMICCEDDFQVDPKWCRFFMDSVPPEYKQNVKMVSYPGAGHLLEPPYSPHCRKTKPPKARMIRGGIHNEEFFGKCLLSGGYTQPHSAAQEDMWKQLLDFLNTHL